MRISGTPSHRFRETVQQSAVVLSLRVQSSLESIRALLPFHARQIRPRSSAGEPVAAAQAVVQPKEEFEFLAACPAAALPAGVEAIRAVARAEARVACDRLGAAQSALAAKTPADGQAPPGICECVLRPILPVRAELASAFAAQVLAVALLLVRLPFGPPSLAIGTSRRRREAKGKADFRDGLRAWVDRSLNRYSIEAGEPVVVMLSEAKHLTSRCQRCRTAATIKPEILRFVQNDNAYYQRFNASTLQRITSRPFAACLRLQSTRAWRCRPEHFSFGHNP